MKTDIVNKTKQSFELKEGNAGAYRFLKQLDPEAKVSIKVDPNATYREYMVATGKKGESILLTSDDFSEYKVIDIVQSDGEDPGTVTYKSMTRDPRKPGMSKASKTSNVGGAGCESNAEGRSNAKVALNPPTSSIAMPESVPPTSSEVTTGSIPPVLSTTGVESDSPASLATRVGLDPPASSIASSKLSKNERIPWYKKPKSWFK